jgi:hypothetical protein
MSDEEIFAWSIVMLISTVLAYCRGYNSGFDAGMMNRRR